MFFPHHDSLMTSNSFSAELTEKLFDVIGYCGVGRTLVLSTNIFNKNEVEIPSSLPRTKEVTSVALAREKW